MADSKLSALTELATTPAATDEFYLNDGGTSKRIQYSNLGITAGFTSIVEDETNGNYAIGLSALDSLTAGSGLDNIAIGGNAGTAVTTGDRNTFVGDNAGALVNTGVDNTFIGCAAGDAITSGGFNTALGAGALGSTAIGASSNVAVGYLAGNSADTLNVLVGNSSGREAGSNNVVIGHYALDDNQVNNNIDDTIAIGYYCASEVTATSSSIYIGSKNGAASFDPDSLTDDYQIAIGGGNMVNVINGYLGAATDVDHSAKSLTITGPSAFATASTNLSAGDLILRGGSAATTGAGVGGDLVLRGGAPGSTGTSGNVYIADSNSAGVSFWNATPVAQQSGTGETTGFTAGAGTGVNDDSTFTGNVGSTAYRINDIVKALKNYGLLAA